MIAGSYTPFTTLALKGDWAWGMTTAVWTIAGLGILGKIFVPHLREGLWIALYLLLGWIVVFAFGPVSEALSRPALVLLVLGGLVYTAGIIWHVKEDLTFSRSIWHGHVVAGAGVALGGDPARYGSAGDGAFSPGDVSFETDAVEPRSSSGRVSPRRSRRP